MGAGSAKGVQAEHENEVDSFSSTSTDHWETEDDPPPPPAPPKPPKPPKPKPLPPPSPLVLPSTSTTAPIIENGEREKPKKKTTFGFSLKRDTNQNTPKNDDSDDSDDDGERQEVDKEEKSKDTKEKKSFRLFGWKKDDKKQENNEALDEDISDLEKTFDSLGIVGQNKWHGDDSTSVEREDVVLSPMRKRKGVRGRVKGVNGAANGGTSSGSNGSKRTFKFSWESENQKMPPKDDGDEWEYKAVVIEGFDIEKFRKANLKESVFDNHSLPNVVGGEDEAEVNTVSPPLRYDQTEQYILASIERDFAN